MTRRIVGIVSFLAGVIALVLFEKLAKNPDTSPVAWYATLAVAIWLILTFTNKLCMAAGIKSIWPSLLASLAWIIMMIVIFFISIGTPVSTYQYPAMVKLFGFYLVVGMPVIDFLDLGNLFTSRIWKSLGLEIT